MVKNNEFNSEPVLTLPEKASRHTFCHLDFNRRTVVRVRESNGALIANFEQIESQELLLSVFPFSLLLCGSLLVTQVFVVHYDLRCSNLDFLCNHFNFHQ